MRRSALLFVVVGALASVNATAHTYPIERSGVLQLHTAHAELLLVYVEPPGPRTKRILALYDQNGNGNIDGVEKALARRTFLRRAFHGLDIEFGTKSSKKAPEIRYKRDKDGGLSVAILQRIDLVIPSNELELKVALAKGETIVPLQLIVEPVGRWALDGLAPATERKLDLAAGVDVQIKLY